ncbi:hypothetical protein M5G07_10430 [Serratia symbiotica]|nr:hypothetical protein [Serratia symbiotica]
MKQNAREQAAVAIEALSHTALWSFFTLFIGAVISALAWLQGVTTNTKRMTESQP